MTINRLDGSRCQICGSLIHQATVRYLDAMVGAWLHDEVPLSGHPAEPDQSEIRELCERQIHPNHNREPYEAGKIDMAEAVLAVIDSRSSLRSTSSVNEHAPDEAND